MAQRPKDGVATPGKILDVNLFGRFLSTPDEFGPETSSIGSSLKLSFHPYKENPKRTLYASWALILVRAAPGLRYELELDLGPHLGDSNRISIGPTSLFGNPCWSLESLCHSPSVVVSMEDMSSSVIIVIGL